MNYRYIKQSTGKVATRATAVRLVIATVALLNSTNWLTTAHAQFGRINRGEAMAQEQILLAPRSLTRLLREGKTAIEEMRYSDGIASLGALLLQEPREDLPEEALRQDYFTEAAGESYYKNSVRSEALRLLGSIPEEGRKILEIQYGVSARQALQAAVEARDIEAITDVTRKYYHTEAGYDASILLAQDKLIRGYPIAAAGILERLSIYPAARKRFGAQLVGEVAATWMQAGRTDLAVRALEEGVKQFAGASILVGNRQVTLEKSQAWAKLLNQVYAQQPQAGERALDAWLMSGGQPDRNGTASAGLPMPMAAWHMTLHRDRSDEETVTMLAGRQNQTTTALLPKLEARMLGDVVLAKTATANVFAIDLETGLRKWPFYKDSLPVSFAPRAPNLAIDSDEVFVHNNLRNRIWGSSAFGQFTVDSNQLYYITSSEDQRLMQPTFNFQRMGSAPIYNMLIGVSLQGEGKEMWQVGGEDSLSEPELAGAYFLGPPTSFEGDLYALVEINMETRLVVLDARTGKLQWAQQLSLSPMAPIRSDPLRQSQALTPSISDAIIVCPVGNGAIIAVDLLTRSLLWGKQYVTNSLPASPMPFNGMDPTESYEPTEERWQEPQVLIHDGQVVFTPPESNTLLCLDLLTGMTRWQQNRSQARYIAGIYQDRIIVVSNSQVYAINLQRGDPSWGDDISLWETVKKTTDESNDKSGNRQRERIAGKSVRDGKFLYVPTSGNRVLKIDLDAGRLVDEATVDEPLGNLFAFKNRLISVGATRITAYYTRDSLSREVEQRLAANPKDNWALNQQALLLVAQSRTEEAIELLRKSYAIDPNNGETRYLLVDALMTALEQDFERYLPVATEFEPIIESQHFRFLILLAKGNLRAGQHELAFGRLMELVRERSRARQPSLQARLETMTISPGYEVDIDSWIAAQLGRTFEQATPDARARMLALVEQRLASAATSHPVTREMELRFLAWLEPAQPALIALASSMLGDVDQTMGERLLQPVLYSSQSDLREQAQVLMKQNAKADDEAMLGYAGDLMSIAPDGSLIPTDNRGLQLLSNVSWPNGMIEAKVGRNEGPATFIQSRVKQTGTRYGRSPVELGLAHDHLIVTNQMGHSIGNCMYQRSASELNDVFLNAQVDGGLVFLETHTELLAFDMYRAHSSPQDASLWRYSLDRIPNTPRKSHSSPIASPHISSLGFKTYTRGSKRDAIIGPVTPAGVAIQKESEVIMLNAMTGNRLWSRAGYDERTAMAHDGLELAVISHSTGKIDILDCRDGALLRQLDYRGDWKNWFTSERYVVQHSEIQSTAPSGGIQVDGTYASALRVLDAMTGKVILTKEFPPLSKADQSGERYIVVLEESGKLWYCDVLTGKAVDHVLPKQTKLASVRVQQFGERLVVWSAVSGSASGIVRTDPVDNDASRGVYPVNGNIVALDAATGQMIWDKPGMLHRFVFNSVQPRNSPYSAFYRILQVAGTRTAQLAVVDLRDGTLAYLNANLPLNIQNGEGSEFAMELHPERLTARISIGSTMVHLQMTEEEKPPQPVVYFGALPTRPQTRQPFEFFSPPK